jgi:integrase/recombinase XerC
VRGKKVRIVSLSDQALFLSFIDSTRHPLRNRVMVLLSFKSGLRAGEIAGLDWAMTLDPRGRISNGLEIAGNIAKYGSGRYIPCHPELRKALRDLHRAQGKPLSGPVCRSERGGALTAQSVAAFFSHAYRAAGLHGCSSHSGRRTMITTAARSLAKVGGSLRDVQELAGHRNLATTSGYIDGSREAQLKLIRLL